uniref:Sema domain-containing protein n=1 Tax=Gongylonema pulchrum TaxID=637853 RepID=A0A183EB52_9BILA
LRNMSMHESVFDMECVTFYMQLMPDGRLIFHQLNVFRDVHPSNIGRMLWTEDPYHRKFYYAQKEKNKKMTIYSVPFGDILETLLDGKPGAPVQSFHGDDFRYLSVSRGVAIVYAFEAGNAKQFIYNLYGSLMTVVCNGTNPDIQQFDQSNSLRLLFDDDFCALQNANGGKCTVRGMRIVEEVIKEDQTLSSYFWLIALIIALILVIMVLLICLYRRRNVMETTFTKMNRSQVQYYPTFSSERSFDY